MKTCSKPVGGLPRWSGTPFSNSRITSMFLSRSCWLKKSRDFRIHVIDLYGGNLQADFRPNSLMWLMIFEARSTLDRSFDETSERVSLSGKAPRSSFRTKRLEII